MATATMKLRALWSQLTQGIDGLGTFAQFEVQLRGGDIAALANAADHLASLHLIAPLDQQRIAMGVGRDPTVGMANQKQIAEAAQLVAGIDDDAIVGRTHRGAQRSSDIDAVIVHPAVFGPEG